MSRSRTSPWIVILATLALVPDAAEACSCVAPIAGNPPCKSFWDADAVFAGRAVAVQQEEVADEVVGERVVRRSGLLHYTFEVEEGFRGVDRGTVEVLTSSSGASCGADFDVGKSYFVYAYYGSDDELHTGLCSRTRRLARADEDLRYARRIAAGEEPTLIYGVALHYRRKARSGYPESSPIAGARIHLEGPGNEKLTAATHDDGRFWAEVAGGGTYRVDAEWSAKRPPARTKTVTVEPGRCAAVELEAGGDTVELVLDPD